MTILFQGDSITDCARNRESLSDLGQGYALKVAKIYGELHPDKDITFINRGISGNRVVDLFSRYEEDFLALKPDVISILIGINDTWRRYDNNEPTCADDFYDVYDKLLCRIKKDMPNTKIIIIEPFLLNTIEEYAVWREDLDPKIQMVRKLARKYANAYLPLDGILQSYVVKGNSDASIAEDSVHPTQLGHAIIAREYIRVLEGL